MTQAFISTISQLNGDLLGAPGKLAHIWFDRVVVQEVFPGFTEEVILAPAVEDRELRPTIADELRKIWKPMQIKVRQVSGPFVGPESQDEALFFDATCKAVMTATSHIDDREEFFREGPFGRGGHIHTPTMRANLISNTLASLAGWWSISAQEPCGLIPTPIERQAVDLMAAATPAQEQFPLFSRLVEQRLPDVDSLSWDRIFELRNHSLLEAFRAKLASVAELADQDEAAAAELLTEIELHDLREIARLSKPNPLKTILRVLVSNIPLPIFINPVSLFFDGKDLKRDFDLNRRFGWLYFMLDLTSRPKRSSIRRRKGGGS